MIQAIFFDLDGTLLDNDKRIPASAYEALEKCRERGIALFVATARPPILEKMLGWGAAEERLFSGGVYCNGACEWIGEHLAYHFMPREVVECVIQEVKHFAGLNLALQMRGEQHAFRYRLSKEAWGPWGVEPRDAISLEQANLSEVVKLLVFYENLIDSVTELPRDLVEDIRKSYGAQAKIYETDQGKLLQIVGSDVSKYGTIQSVCDQMGWQAEEIVVFGDDHNDEEMLAGFPHSVAMGNAPQNLKDRAEYVTRSNEEDGIAYAVEQWILPCLCGETHR